MRVYIIRHAAAGDRGDYASDEARELTAKGIECMKVVGKALKRIGIAPAKIFTSPLVRARQTAEIAAKAIGRVEAAHNYLVEREELKPDGEASAVVAFLSKAGLEESAIVGHEPQLGEVVSLMVAGSREPVVDMKKAAVACIEFDGPVKQGEGVVAWHLVPSVAAALMQGRLKSEV